MPSTEFDWQADEEQEWEAAQLEGEGGKRPQPRRLGWLIFLLLIAFAAAATLFFILNRRVDEAVTQAEQEVLTAHQLLIGAVEANDYELYMSLLSDRPPNWQFDQRELLSLDLFWGRTVFGLQPGTVPQQAQENIEIEIDPELRQAVVSHIRPFEVAGTGGISSTINLERTFFYERTDQAWQLTSIEEVLAFWGDWQRATSDHLTLVYPQRDAATARQLAPLLDGLIAGLCSEPRLNCPRNFQLELKLDRDESSLLRIGEGYYSVGIPVRGGKGNVTLPAPSLIGRPLDEAGYQALLEGYASWMGAVMINNFANQEPDIGQQLIAELLAEHDLAAPSHPQPMMPWPADVILPVGLSAIPHDVLMLCTGGNTQRLLRFNTDTAIWSNEWLFRIIDRSGAAANFPGPTLHRLPDYKGALVSFAQDDEAQLWHTYLWQNGQEQLWLEHEQAPFFLLQRLFFPVLEQTPVMKGYYLQLENNETALDPWWIDVEACHNGSCQNTAADGVPLWSPDGARTLLVNMASSGRPELHLGDDAGRGIQNLGEGFPVSWISNERFAFLRQRIPAVVDPTQLGIWKELVLGTISAEQNEVVDPQVIIDASDLEAGIAIERASFQLGIVTATPYQEGWFIAARELGPEIQSGSYLFYYQPRNDELRVVLENEMEMILPPLLLDLGGPYVAVPALREDDFLLRLLDLGDGKEVYRTNRFPHDWSADGHWLLFVDDRALRITAPTLDFEWTIEHNLPNCDAAVWNERE
ncbi:MAG: hypothetical protein R3293_08125 [Candidatus Promineifilaceae bacterium]|nr:hypothetical protein [Candidatus Promineifilaceae bacterium]